MISSRILITAALLSMGAGCASATRYAPPVAAAHSEAPRVAPPTSTPSSYESRAPQSGWSRFEVGPCGGIAIHAPTLEELPPEKKTGLRTFGFALTPKAVATISCAEFGGIIPKDAQPKALDAVQTVQLRAPKARLLSSRAVSFEGFSGREVCTDSPQGSMCVRLFIVGRHLVQLMVVGFSDVDTRAFFGGLELLEE